MARLRQPNTVPDLSRLFDIALDATGRSPRTREAYADAARALNAWLMSTDHSNRVTDIDRDEIRQWLIYERDTHSPGTAASRYGGIVQLFKFAVAEGDLTESPMIGVAKPKVPERPPAVLTDAVIDQLLSACSGREFEDRRDTAIIRVLEGTGMRLQELTNLRWTDDPNTNTVDTETWHLVIVRKGNRESTINLGSREARLALRRYLNLRDLHPHADLPNLWIARKGAMTASGISQMLERRRLEAGLPTRIHAHQLRHSFADRWMAKEGSETGLMAAMGWRSRAMLNRYGAANAEARGRAEAERLRIGDR